MNTQQDVGKGWVLLLDGAPLRRGDGFWHANTGYWLDFDCRPDLFRGDREFVHSGWQWRRKSEKPAMNQQTPSPWALRAAREIIECNNQGDDWSEINIAVLVDRETNLPALIEAARDFINKVDQGRAKSTDSYAKFKAALQSR